MKLITTYLRPSLFSEETTYRELLQHMPADVVTFQCPKDADFILSLEADGYTEHRLSHTQEECAKWMAKKEHTSTESMPTSVAGWTIYEESDDRYYDIEITNVGDVYEVSVERKRTEMRLRMV